MKVNNDKSTRRVLPVITQRQVGHVLQSLKGLGTDSTDLIPGYEQIPGVSGYPGWDTPQVFGDALHGVSRLGALATRRTRRVNGAEERAEHKAQRQVQHVGKFGNEETRSKNEEEKGTDQLLRYITII